jgi:hypothetical protein
MVERDNPPPTGRPRCLDLKFVYTQSLDVPQNLMLDVYKISGDARGNEY